MNDIDADSVPHCGREIRVKYFLHTNIEAALTFVTGLDMFLCVSIHISPLVPLKYFLCCAISSLVSGFFVESLQNGFFVIFVAYHLPRHPFFGVSSEQNTVDNVVFRGLNAGIAVLANGDICGDLHRLEKPYYFVVVLIILGQVRNSQFCGHINSLGRRRPR